MRCRRSAEFPASICDSDGSTTRRQQLITARMKSDGHHPLTIVRADATFLLVLTLSHRGENITKEARRHRQEALERRRKAARYQM